MEKINVLLVNHSREKCGIQQFGQSIYKSLQTNPHIAVSYLECESSESLFGGLRNGFFDVVIYNHHTHTMGWMNQDVINNASKHVKKQFCISGHDQTADFSGTKNIIPDPTGRDSDKNKYTGRILPNYPVDSSLIEIPTIGSFGFGFPEKNFDRLADIVNNEFERAKIRIHITASDFGDPSGHLASVVLNQIQSKIKSGIEVELSCGFLSQQELVMWLSKNSVNCFLYNDQPGRGISSAVDFALAARRPIAITNSSMFRHIKHLDTILIEKNSVKAIISAGVSCLSPFYEGWTEEKIGQRYFDIITND
jgi:glycosyltransferase involved in cell wall biosynthesis